MAVSDLICPQQKSNYLAELSREISGLSQLASEFYTISNQCDDPDKLSLDRSGNIIAWLLSWLSFNLSSLHERVLLRCQTKYQTPDKASPTSRCFVILTSLLIFLGITASFWLKNFSSYSQQFSWRIVILFYETYLIINILHGYYGPILWATVLISSERKVYLMESLKMLSGSYIIYKFSWAVALIDSMFLIGLENNAESNRDCEL